MDEPILMKEVNTGNSLNEEVESSLFSETALLLYQHEKVTFGDVLHHKVNVLVILQVRIHPNDINMLEFLMDLNLSPQRLLHLWSFDHAFIEFFNGHFNTAWFMHG